jgi:hypothetical protein
MIPVGPLAAIVQLLATGCTARAPSPAPSPAPASTAPSPAAACGSPVSTDALPTWARAGFSWDGSGMPHVLSREGGILGVLFGNPLSAPPAPDRANKILWVSQLPLVPGDPLRITARLDGTSETASREVAGGPGPSIIDLPRPGCWRLTLEWSGHRETMDLTYQA